MSNDGTQPTGIAVRVRQLYKSFGAQHVYRGLDVDIEKGRISFIIGRSGEGKSLLMRLILGLDHPDSGEIWIDGLNVAAARKSELLKMRRRFGVLFQGAALFDSMNVFENVAFPLFEHTKKSRKDVANVVHEKLEQVGLSGVDAKMPSDLSGGMRKRVGLARALALEPEIVFFDEPTSGLDPIMGDVVDRLIKDTHAATGVTFVVISHDIHNIVRIADRIHMLHDGVIRTSGTPEEFWASRDPIVRRFLEGDSAGFAEAV
ncbi:MAG: ABC transporter ATP-binding protein [Myxococcales bacterium]|nr:ABC transporter ATP-binding protein [Myxococcales bacterium]